MSESITSHEGNGQAAEGRPFISVELVVRLRHDVPPQAFVVWVYLWARAGRHTAMCWPGQRRVGDDLGINRRSVERCIKTLESAGWLAVNRRRGRAGNQYKVCTPQKMDTRLRPLDAEGMAAIPTLNGRNFDTLMAAKGIPQHYKEHNQENTCSSVSLTGDHNTTTTTLTLIDLIRMWNQIPGVRQCSRPTTQRQTMFDQRMKHPDWAANVPESLARIGKSSKLTGKNGYPTSLDWYLGSEDAQVRILEGQFDDPTKKRRDNGRVYNDDITDPMLVLRKEAAEAEQRQREQPWSREDSDAVRRVLRRVE